MFVLSACNHADKIIKETISNADSIAIKYYTEDGRTDTVTSVKIIRDKNAINQLVDLISASKIPIKTNCGYDGSIHFFKMDTVVQDINFRMNDDNCKQFSFMEDGKPAATNLSENAKQLLKSLK